MSEGIIELEGSTAEETSVEDGAAAPAEEEISEQEAESLRKLPKAKTRKQKRDQKKALFDRMKQDSQLKYKLKENDVFRLRLFFS
jgi:hypothetical protein